MRRRSSRRSQSRRALFRALVEAGAGPVVAYTADEQIRAMVSEIASASVQSIVLEMRQRFAEQGRRLDSLAHAAAERDRKLDTLIEVVELTRDAHRRELRLVWGALGALLAVQLAMLGFMLSH